MLDEAWCQAAWGGRLRDYNITLKCEAERAILKCRKPYERKPMIQ